MEDLDPIQSLLHQLTNMANTQGQMQGPKPVQAGGGNGWGPGPVPLQLPNSWNSNLNHPSPAGTSASVNPMWDYREQYLKMQQMKAEEEMLAARKKQEDELERKRIQEEEDARKRIEEQKRMEMEQEQKRKAYEVITHTFKGFESHASIIFSRP